MSLTSSIRRHEVKRSKRSFGVRKLVRRAKRFMQPYVNAQGGDRGAAANYRRLQRKLYRQPGIPRYKGQ